MSKHGWIWLLSVILVLEFFGVVACLEQSYRLHPALSIHLLNQLFHVSYFSFLFTWAALFFVAGSALYDQKSDKKREQLIAITNYQAGIADAEARAKAKHDADVAEVLNRYKTKAA